MHSTLEPHRLTYSNYISYTAIFYFVFAKRVDFVYAKETTTTTKRMMNQHNLNQMWFSNTGNPLLHLLCNLVEIQFKVKVELGLEKWLSG